MSTQFTRRHVLTGTLAGALTLTLAACGSAKDSGSSVKGLSVKDGVATITIGATPQPHVTMLQWVKENLAKDAGLDLEIKEINDYQTPNSSLADGSLAANFYQTPDFLEAQKAEKKYDFTSIANVHVEPMGVYTKKGYKSLEELPEGAKVILNSDPANFARGLQLLATNGVIELDKNAKLPADTDVTSNPKKLTFTPIEGSLLVTSMADADIAVINGNYAIDGGLVPSKEAIALEPGEGSPHANLLVVRTENKDDAHLKKLAELLNSDKFREYIKSTWTDGSVIPAF
ncbi:Methionine-binding lipoprotein metQ precursor [Actinomyces bovis]|uniref:Lipoprotein n=1 Tax=Actinomyces bovis TaxID=1658 RepID=A0ABY1VR35_9ACTO|nr:MetQ/NlpA family ABC transporter substrate-binding protein [Actinomyces bovis]SPT55047.1 Methionine-binding lipoprotein metQ precursor [Actinomyces bovis]VEG56213.1 Methionine-binding lipoprotein metQ precursor [Actinomyces israelii]